MPRRINNNDTGSMTLVPRNPVARSAQMNKGGVHQETKTSQRQHARQALGAELESWRDDLEFERSLKADEDK